MSEFLSTVVYPVTPFKLSIKLAVLMGIGVIPSQAYSRTISQQEIQTSLKKYNTYLNQLTQFFVSLTQTCHKDGKASLSKGTLYVQKPGKLRLSYKPDHTLDLIADGKQLVQYDWRNNDKNSLSLEETPLYFLLHRGNLEDLATIQKIILSPETNTTKIVVKSKQDPASGTVTLEFQDAPLRLVSWTLTDPQGGHTKVSLGKIHRNVSIDPKVFIMKGSGK
jgi:outer membrane lipoprotein-sorting protein